jgi:UPF0755 protein
MMSEMNPVDLTRNDTSALPKTSKRRASRFPLLALIVLFGIGSYAYTLTLPPASFSPDTLIEIPGGSTLASTAKILAAHGIIRSPLYFSLLITNSGKEKLISSGTYLFHEPEDIFSVAKRFAVGDHGIETEKVTLPEGLSIKEMTTVLERELSTFNAEEFLNLSRGKEGYLFPDTYFFFSTATSGEIYMALTENFKKKTVDIRASSTQLGKDWGSIVTMASIIEGEAVTKEDRHIVSGILWTRIKNGMRLGVDAPFVYIMGKGSLELTQSDLATSSPYNTYRNAGLPPTPINNPGMSALEAALYPSTTPYVYYLSDKQGKMHYARTFEEHKLNKEKYLR